MEELHSDESQQKADELLLKIKNTMTDRCIVNKKFVSFLQDWRKKVLSSTVDNWKQLSTELKADMTRVNDLYCGKHLVLNFQEYAGAALSAWEEVESAGRKLGREQHILWNRKSESASLLAVRSVCEAFGPDAHPLGWLAAQVNFHSSHSTRVNFKHTVGTDLTFHSRTQQQPTTTIISINISQVYMKPCQQQSRKIH